MMALALIGLGRHGDGYDPTEIDEEDPPSAPTRKTLIRQTSHGAVSMRNEEDPEDGKFGQSEPRHHRHEAKE